MRTVRDVRTFRDMWTFKDVFTLQDTIYNVPPSSKSFDFFLHPSVISVVSGRLRV